MPIGSLLAKLESYFELIASCHAALIFCQQCRKSEKNGIEGLFSKEPVLTLS